MGDHGLRRDSAFFETQVSMFWRNLCTTLCDSASWCSC